MSEDDSASRLFASVADEYARHRPSYPPELFRALAAHAPGRRLAWDCACGSGQATHGLAEEFTRVIGTDLERAPLRHAAPTPRIVYAQAAAERACVPSGAADCVTVAQALHWLDVDRFYPEVERVLSPGGVFAAWCYVLMEIDPALDPALADFYRGTLRGYWSPERRHVDAGYRTLPFPFDEIELPPMTLRVRWTLDDLLGHLGTWSAVGRFRRLQGKDPLPALRERLADPWGDPGMQRDVRWPLAVRAGTKPRDSVRRS